MEKEKNTFVEKSWGFPPEFTKGVNPTRVVTGDENIRQSLFILFSTLPTERIYRPDYGFSFKELLFEPASLSTRVHIEKSIEEAILLYEPRIELDRVVIHEAEAMDGIWKIQIDYTIKENNNADSFTYSLKV
ncbi:GPW/gp25 family protein [Parabacteroides sp. OttesenSCG-928-G06]|nr:GPW/gp25 family protein [Parabacteroides sp. OttesenSCG-928-G06]